MKLSNTHICIRGQAAITKRGLLLWKTCHFILDIHSNIIRPITMSCGVTCICDPICMTDIYKTWKLSPWIDPIKHVFGCVYTNRSCNLWCSFLPQQIHLVSLCFYCSEHWWNLSGMLFSMVNTCPWMLKNLKIWSSSIYSFGNSQKSDITKSGKYGGLSNFITDVLAKKSLTASAP